MTAPLRKWHLRAVIVLSVALATLFLASLLHRAPSVPPNDMAPWLTGGGSPR